MVNDGKAKAKYISFCLYKSSLHAHITHLHTYIWLTRIDHYLNIRFQFIPNHDASPRFHVEKLTGLQEDVLVRLLPGQVPGHEDAVEVLAEAQTLDLLPLCSGRPVRDQTQKVILPVPHSLTSLLLYQTLAVSAHNTMDVQWLGFSIIFYLFQTTPMGKRPCIFRFNLTVVYNILFICKDILVLNHI